MVSRQTKRREQTQRKMLESASRSFRSHGYAGIGVDAIAKGAGVTSGAFYAHLGSKDAAFAAALELGLNDVIEAIPAFQADHGSRWVEAFADYYLGKAHREDLACGCAMTTLSPEVVRGGPELHALYETLMSKIVGLIARGLTGKTMSERRAKGWSLLHVLIGGLTTARAVATPRLAAQIAAAAKRTAIEVVK